MPPKKKSSSSSSAAAAAKAAAISAGKRQVGEAATAAPSRGRAPPTGSSGRFAPPASAPVSNSKPSSNSRKQKAPKRSRASDDDASDAVAALAAAATTAAAAAATRGGANNGGGAGPSRPAGGGGGGGVGGGGGGGGGDYKPSKRKAPRFIPDAPPPPAAPLNVPKVSLKVELSSLGGAFVGRKALSVVVPADAALWDVRRSIDATCRSLNNGLAPPHGVRMAMRTLDLGAGGEAGTSASAGEAKEGPPLTLETVNAAGRETFLASYSIVPCPGGVYTLEMRPTKQSREEEAKWGRKRSRRSIDGGGEGDDDDGLGALALPPRGSGRGRPRSAHLNPSGRPRSASSLARAAAFRPPPIAEDGSRVHLDNGARKRIKWSTDETAVLVGGVQQYGDGQWATIRKAHLALFESTGRTDVDLKDKWRNLKRAMRRDSTVPGLSGPHLATLRAAVADDDRKAAGGGGE